MLIEIKNDPYFISQRLKDIDQSYYLVFNCIKGKYEVHSSKQVGCSYCLTSPYEGLDARLLELARNTRRENLKELITKIDEENAKLEAKNTKKLEEICQPNKY